MSGLRYARTIVIAHGASEIILCKSIRSNLRLKMVIISESSGKSSVQIAGLNKFLKSGCFRTHKQLSTLYSDLEYDKGKIQGVTIFPMMDTDDCSEKMFDAYKTRELFSDTLYHDIITPIYNVPSLDSVMQSMGYPIDVENKTKSYHKCFPGENGDVKTVQSIIKKARSQKHSNLEVFLEHCLSEAQSNCFLQR